MILKSHWDDAAVPLKTRLASESIHTLAIMSYFNNDVKAAHTAREMWHRHGMPPRDDDWSDAIRIAFTLAIKGVEPMYKARAAFRVMFEEAPVLQGE
jgi:hypothetical protein